MNKHSLIFFRRHKKRTALHISTKQLYKELLHNEQTFNQLKEKTRSIILNGILINGLAMPITMILTPLTPINTYAIILTFYCIYLTVKNNSLFFRQ